MVALCVAAFAARFQCSSLRPLHKKKSESEVQLQVDKLQRARDGCRRKRAK